MLDVNLIKKDLLEEKERLELKKITLETEMKELDGMYQKKKEELYQLERADLLQIRRLCKYYHVIEEEA